MEEQPVLLYDGDCGFCKRWVAWAKRHDATVDFAPCQDATLLRTALNIPDARCKETALYVDGKGVLTHDQAIHAVLRRLPGGRNVGWRAVGRMGSLAVFWPLGRLGYQLVAKNRHRLRGPRP